MGPGRMTMLAAGTAVLVTVVLSAGTALAVTPGASGGTSSPPFT